MRTRIISLMIVAVALFSLLTLRVENASMRQNIAAAATATATPTATATLGPTGTPTPNRRYWNGPNDSDMDSHSLPGQAIHGSGTDILGNELRRTWGYDLPMPAATPTAGQCVQAANNVLPATTQWGSCGSGGGVPNGGPPQVVGYSATNTGEAETVSGDFTFSRTGANAYSATVTKTNGTAFSGLATLSLSQGQFAQGTSGAPTGTYIPPADIGPIDLGRAASSMYKSQGIDQSAWNHWGALGYALVPSGGTPIARDGIGTPVFGNSPLSVPMVTTPVNGELLLMFIGYGDFVSSITPGGLSAWNLGVCAANNTGCIYWRIASSEPSSYSISGASPIAAVIMQYKNVATPSSNPSSNAKGSSGLAVMSTLTTASSNNLVINCDWTGITGGNRAGFVPTQAGWTFVSDPVVQVTTTNDTQGGINNLTAFQNGTVTTFSGMSCFQKFFAAAGATGTATANAGMPILVYEGTAGEIDHFNEITNGNGVTGDEITMTVVRDGETTPSVNAIRLQDFAAGHGSTGTSVFSNRGFAYVRGANGGGYSANKYVMMPWTNSMQVWLTDPDTSNGITMWSEVDYHQNSLPASAWGGRAHYHAVGNASYPSTDSVAAYAEDTLLPATGVASVLRSVFLNVVGGDNNSEAFEEGQLRVYINGESNASIVSSGTEDAFEASFNWTGQTAPYGNEFYGLTGFTAPGVSTPGAFAAYRMFGLNQPVANTSNLKVGWTAGTSTAGGVTNNVNVYSVVEYYTGS